MSTLDTSGEVKSDAHSELELRRIRFCWILGSLERSSNCARIISNLPHLLAHLSHILAKEKEIWRKREVTNGKKSYSLCHARLCGGGDLLKALGIVAGYLADAIFYLTNDNILCVKLYTGFQPKLLYHSLLGVNAHFKPRVKYS
jgi:hypothetical protein